MPSLGPRNVITKLVVIRGVIPRGNTGSVIRSRAPNQIDGRDAVGGVRAGKESVEFEIGRGSDQAQRQKREAISVIIEGNFIDQVRANDIGGMHNGSIGWIAEVGTDGRYIVAGEYGRTVALGDLFGHQMAVDRELVTYVFIDPDDFLSYVGRQIITANEAVAIGRCREDAAMLPTGRQQGLGVAIQQTCWNHIVTEGDLFCGVRCAVRTTAERLSRGRKLGLDGRGHLAHGRSV